MRRSSSDLAGLFVSQVLTKSSILVEKIVYQRKRVACLTEMKSGALLVRNED